MPVVGDFTQPYEASNTGKIRNARTGKTLKPRISDRGYLRIGLATAGGSRSIALHRLVAGAFHGMCDGLEVNHIDGNKLNNTPNNLEWVTSDENLRHYYHILNGKRSYICRPGELNGNSRLSNIQVSMIKQLLLSGIPQSEVAIMYDVSVKTINHISTGRRWSSIK